MAFNRSHRIPIGTRVRWNLVDIRIAGETDAGRVGCVVGHEFRHGVVPMYVVKLTHPVTLRTGGRTHVVLLWECQLEPMRGRSSRPAALARSA